MRRIEYWDEKRRVLGRERGIDEKSIEEEERGV
jgi:hypothetical protein